MGSLKYWPICQEKNYAWIKRQIIIVVDQLSPAVVNYIKALKNVYKIKKSHFFGHAVDSPNDFAHFLQRFTAQR